MSDGVLDQRLNREHWDDRLQHLRRHLQPHAQTIAEPGSLEAQVLLHVMQLVGQGHVGPLPTERVARELGELGQQLARLLRAGVRM